MRLVKVLLIPAALAFAPAASLAAPVPPGGNAGDEIGTGIETTPVYHRHGYYHDRYYYRPYYRYRPYPYHYRPYRYHYRPYRHWRRWHRYY